MAENLISCLHLLPFTGTLAPGLDRDLRGKPLVPKAHSGITGLLWRHIALDTDGCVFYGGVLTSVLGMI